MRMDEGFGMLLFLYENQCLSLCLFALHVSLCMLLLYVYLHVPGIHLHPGLSAYRVFVPALLCVRAGSQDSQSN